ncbi:MAG: hypothetical protein WC648_03335 [Candidatus Paceibacterota bacterium]|jgi:hypothetical protein
MNTHTSAQSKKFIELLEQKWVTPERFQTVLGSGILSDIFEEKATLSNRFAVRQALCLGPLPSEPIVLIVDYGQTLEQMIVAGRYDWKNDDITVSRFPIEGKGTVEFEAVLFHFDKDISSEDAKKQIEEAGYEVGKIEHVLSFGANYPEEQRKFPIVGLGSVGEVGGRRYVPDLYGDGSDRDLNLGWWDSDWDADCRFLGVRKKVSQISVS